jgi:hypothetical protein
MATDLLGMSAMADVLLIYTKWPLRLTGGRLYTAQACGRQRDDGTWEGWLEFVPDDGSVVLRSQRETTQPNLADLEYWATGITPVYLQGALERTLSSPVVSEPAPVLPSIPSVYDEPAPPPASATSTPVAEPVLDPFSVYTKGEDMLRRQLSALSPRHLRAIIVGYALADPDVDLEVLTARELIVLIVVAVRQRLAA